MELEQSFTVPVGVDDAWKVLLDIERVATCMPGAALDTIDGDDFTGTVKIKIGPISLTYKGKASYLEKDETAHRLVIDTHGRDTRGNGTAAAKVTATMSPEGDSSTKVDVHTDLDITGKPAQFGRGVMVDVGNKLIGQFADCLAGKLSGSEPASGGTTASSGPAAAPTSESSGAAEPSADAAPVTAGTAGTETPVPAPSRSAPRSASRADDVQPIDLLASAGPAVAKRLVPVLAAILLILVILRRRRH